MRFSLPVSMPDVNTATNQDIWPWLASYTASPLIPQLLVDQSEAVPNSETTTSALLHFYVVRNVTPLSLIHI